MFPLMAPANTLRKLNMALASTVLGPPPSISQLGAPITTAWGMTSALTPQSRTRRMALQRGALRLTSVPPRVIYRNLRGMTQRKRMGHSVRMFPLHLLQVHRMDPIFFRAAAERAVVLPIPARALLWVPAHQATASLRGSAEPVCLLMESATCRTFLFLRGTVF